MKLRTGLIFVLLLVVASAPKAAWAWGGDGHRIVCAIAWDELKTPVRFKVEDLLAVHDRESFADLCLWADEYRDQGHRETASWHFVNVPKGATTVDLTRDCSEPKSCVVAQIERDTETLSGNAPKEEKATALKFLMHFVGDIHQPLHVGHAEDRGGNAIKGEFLGKKTDMHTLWDTDLIKQIHRPGQELARDLRRHVTAEKRHVWIGSTPIVWANESLAIANTPPTKYAVPQQHFAFGLAYEHDELPVVYDRLSRAGVRLAHLLNDTLSSH